jgi:hypothetical protein
LWGVLRYTREKLDDGQPTRVAGWLIKCLTQGESFEETFEASETAWLAGALAEKIVRPIGAKKCHMQPARFSQDSERQARDPCGVKGGACWVAADEVRSKCEVAQHGSSK